MLHLVRCRCLAIVCFVAVFPVANAQEGEGPASRLDTYYIDFAVPNLSAFSLLGVNDERVSRPGNVREFSTALANGLGEEGSLEQGLGFEVAPWLTLFSPPTSVSDYDPLLHRLTFSAATVREADTTRIGVGFRWVLLDEADPYDRGNGLRDSIASAISNFDDARDQEKEAFDRRVRDFLGRDVFGTGALSRREAEALGRALSTLDLTNRPVDDDGQPVPPTEDVISRRTQDQLAADGKRLTPGQVETLRTLARAYERLAARTPADVDAVLEKEVAGIKQRFRDRTWNGRAFQIATGLTFRAEGDAEGLGGDEFNAFSSYTHPAFGIILGYRGQIVLHGQIRIPMRELAVENETDLRATIGGRYLTGTSARRLSLEALYGANDERLEEESSWRLTVGGEFQIADGVYLELATGLHIPESESNDFLTLGSLRYAIGKTQRFTIP